jgi:DNA-binding transcriptional MerR regulator
MQIGGVAKKAGLTPDAIRFYERNALLPRAPRTPGGFRQYEDTDLETLGFIRQAQGLGFTLNEVRELLDLRHRRLQPCAPVRLRLSQKLVDVHKKLAGLQQLERELRAALLACDRKLSSRSKRCPLLSGKGSRKSRSEN